MTTAEKVADALLKVNAVTLRPEQPFRYSSGILSPVYTDHRQLMGFAKERKVIAKFLAAKVTSLGKPDFIAATAIGAIPHGAWVADLLALPLVYVRDKPKAHGKQNLVEGYFKKGQHAVIIEDLISTGGSSIKTAEALRAEGCKVKNIVAITTYTLKSSKENFKKAKIKLHNLTSFPTIVEVAIRKRIVKPQDKKMILEWIKDSKGWGKKLGFE